MKKTLCVLSVILFFCTNSFARADITKDEYEIYSKAFEYIYTKFKSSKNIQLVFLDRTVKSAKYSQPPENYLKTKPHPYELYKSNPILIEDLLNSFNKQNNLSEELKSKFTFPYDYKLISQIELDEVLKEGTNLYEQASPKPVSELHSPLVIWKPFRTKYRTDGCSSVSRVGFNKDKTFALVFISQTDGISGDSFYFILNKQGNQWMIYDMFLSSWLI